MISPLAVRYPDTTITWIVRPPDADRLFGENADDQPPERTDRVDMSADGATLVGEDGHVLGPFDRIVGATGFRPDLAMLSELRVAVDATLERAHALAPLIDPHVHSCGSVPPHGVSELAHREPGLYIVGAKSYGPAPTFLLATGYHVAAADVQLVLPETGVCSLDRLESKTVEPAVAPAAVTVADVASVCCG